MPVAFAVADREFYAPLESSRDRGEIFRPTSPPEGWLDIDFGVWTTWYREDRKPGVEDGWKVHVSARADRLAPVLDTVAEICFEQEVTFKHLSCRLFYLWTHHKQAARQANGKFIAVYPRSAEAAGALMERLREALADEEGPHILTDRRYKDSRTVHYRYGAFTRRSRIRPDGTDLLLVRDGNGQETEDRRGMSFVLPEGVSDPFIERVTAARRPAARSASASGPAAKKLSFQGYVFDEAVQFSNGGGVYKGREEASGRPVFIKEARAHSGVDQDGAAAPDYLRGEWRVLQELRTTDPGLAPEPVAYFRQGEHEFLAMELIEGKSLNSWMADNQPMLSGERTPEAFAAYYGRCERILAGIEEALERLHTAGYLFVDVSPGNVLVTEDDGVRLVDFEGTRRPGTPFTPLGTLGYSPPPELVAGAGGDPFLYDDYGVSALAQLLVGPYHHSIRHNPDTLSHLRHELTAYAPVSEVLWHRATKFHRPAGPTAGPTAGPAGATAGPHAGPVAGAAAPGRPERLPAPESVAAEPLRHLAELRDRTGDALLAMADLAHPARVFPTVPDGYRTNTLCVAYGTAGVVHALGRAGRTLPDGLLERLRRDALAARTDLAPGLYVGLSGIAWILADRGLLDEARELLAVADGHPLTTGAASVTLYGGSAGLALAHLALYGRTGDEHHVDRAQALAAALPSDEAITPSLGPDDATGLMHGRCGVALMLHQLAAVTGERDHLRRGVRLLHAELDRDSAPGTPRMYFPISAADSRSLPYLYCGSAGTAHTVTRYLRAVDDQRLAEALPRLLAALRSGAPAMSGLQQGLAGLGFALADHAVLTGDEPSRQEAIRIARGLYKFAVPHPTGVRFLGDRLLRFSADLWSGSAGVLLFLTQLLDPRPGALLTAGLPAAVPTPESVLAPR
ncbi:class III lanthionine synthetase LanKC [Streptomyces sp. NPDC088341]|uniref:class III lanthionine synthetase LanKC n=1 Tax=Streptomyces sp. NPDC088341 TaxID=3154870 RepID=UPI0034340CDC